MSRSPHHLSDEALSAHADGTSDRTARSEIGDHLASCARCAARLDSLGNAAEALRGAAVEPVDNLTRRRMIARALAVATTRPTRVARPGHRLRALAAAAVALVAIGAVSLFAVDTGDGTDEVAGGAFGLPLDADQVAVEVGELDDPAYLQSTLLAFEDGGDVIAGGSVDAGEAGTSAGAGRQAGSGGGAAVGASSVAEDAVGSEAPSPAARSGAPSESRPVAIVAAPPAQGGLPLAPAGTKDLAAIGRCYRSLASSIPDDSKLTAAATGTYQHRKAIVLGLRSGAGGRLLAMVLARDDCSILSAQSFR